MHALCFGLFLGIKSHCNSSSFKRKQMDLWAESDLTQQGFHSSYSSPTHHITSLTIKGHSVQIQSQL